MNFTSFEFVVFLPIVFVVFWLLKDNLKRQNFFIIVASYTFYGWWNRDFLLLIFLSSYVDFKCGLSISSSKDPKIRKKWLYISLVSNLGTLCLFKYFNFFLDSAINSANFFGVNLPVYSLNIILPVGISFYTFQTLSYTIDVYRRKLNPIKDALAFFAYVSFFPQLVAGPIERATHLLPQFSIAKNFSSESAKIAMRQIMWGLSLKLILADSCAPFVNDVFDHYSNQSSLFLVLGAVAFAFQIYGDFAGYSHVAIGVARLFNFDLMNNFNYPYFSRNVGEFWRRWHISLSTWFRDYVYIPLGGNKISTKKHMRNVLIVFILSGLWHGANWTFVAWGLLHAILLLLSNISSTLSPIKTRGRDQEQYSSHKDLPAILLNFFFICIGWVFFRSENIGHAFAYLSRMFSFVGLSDQKNLPWIPLVIITIFIIVEWFSQKQSFPLRDIHKFLSNISRKMLYLTVAFLIYAFSAGQQQFIYFQF